jgi:hypothetical protein
MATMLQESTAEGQRSVVRTKTQKIILMLSTHIRMVLRLNLGGNIGYADKIFADCHSISRQTLGQYFVKWTTVSFQILSNLLLSSHSTIRR